MNVVYGLILYLLLLISLSLHEWAHGFIAYRLRDRTPLMLGRLTLNPLAHIDLIGTVIIPLSMILLMPGFVIFGWAKPVPINPNYFKNRNFGEMITGLAGPLMNLLLAIISAFLGMACAKIFGAPSIGRLFGLMIWVNLMLFVFNLIPIPPLDGSYIVKLIFKISDSAFYNFAQYRFLILLILINIPIIRSMIVIAMLQLFSILNTIVCITFGAPYNLLLPF